MKQFVTLVVGQKCKMNIIPLSRIIFGIITNKQDTDNNKALGYLRPKEKLMGRLTSLHFVTCGFEEIKKVDLEDTKLVSMTNQYMASP